MEMQLRVYSDTDGEFVLSGIHMTAILAKVMNAERDAMPQAVLAFE